MKTLLIKLTGITLIMAIMLGACKKDDDNSGDFTETEPNDAFADADELLVSETYNMKINSGDDHDYFFVSSNSNLSITIDGDSNLELYINVYDETFINLYNGDTGAKGASLNHSIGSDQYTDKLYIMIESAYVGDIGDYTIKIN